MPRAASSDCALASTAWRTASASAPASGSTRMSTSPSVVGSGLQSSRWAPRAMRAAIVHLPRLRTAGIAESRPRSCGTPSSRCASEGAEWPSCMSIRRTRRARSSSTGASACAPSGTNGISSDGLSCSSGAGGGEDSFPGPGAERPRRHARSRKRPRAARPSSRPNASGGTEPRAACLRPRGSSVECQSGCAITRPDPDARAGRSDPGSLYRNADCVTETGGSLPPLNRNACPRCED